MATYDLTSGIPSVLAAGDVLEVPYSGASVSVGLPAGTYRIQCWGASGNRYNSTAGSYGAGGYSTGLLALTSARTVYVRAGGQGSFSSSTGTARHDGGFNGGGHAYSRASSGGGASDVRIGSDSPYARVIVAGGGGGAPYSNNSSSYSSIYGGAGGGTSGQDGKYGTSANTTYAGKGGTSTGAGTNGSSAGDYATAASFGEGAGAGYYSQSYASGGGGGGWYGGGVGRSYYAGGAGGSGYVYTQETAGDYPDGCLLDSSLLLTDASTTAGTSSFASTSGGTETGHDGNGHVRITVVSLTPAVTYTVEASGTGGTEVSPATQEVPEGGSAEVRITGDLSGKKVLDNGADVTSSLVTRADTVAGEASSAPAAYTTSGSISGTNYQSAVGKGSDTASATGNDYCSSSGSTAYIDYTFGIDIPDGATVTGVSCSVKGHCESTTNSSEVARLQLYAGSAAKGGSVDFTSTTDTVVRMPESDWTPEELGRLKLRFTIGYYGGRVTGATVTVTYETGTGEEYAAYTIADVRENHTVTVVPALPVRVKVSGTFAVPSKVLVKVSGQWVGATAVRVKSNGQWT